MKIRKLRRFLVIITLFIAISYPAMAQTTGTADLKINRFAVDSTFDSAGLPQFYVTALFSNAGATAVANCPVVVKINGAQQATQTFSLVEPGYTYIFTGSYPAVTVSGRNTIEISLCPEINDTNKSNNRRKASLNAKKQTNLTTGSAVDLVLTKYDTLLVRDQTNADKYWFYIRYKNNKNNLSGVFSINYKINNLKEGAIQVPALPGLATGVYSSFFTESPFLEGKNLITINLDPDNLIKETSEKNTYYYLAEVSDREIKSLNKISKNQPLLVDNLLYTDERLVSEAIQAKLTGPGSGLLAVPILNVGSDLIGSATTPLNLKISLRQGTVTHEQTFSISDWKKGVKQIFYFTNYQYKKADLGKNFQLRILLNNQEVYNNVQSVQCF